MTHNDMEMALPEDAEEGKIMQWRQEKRKEKYNTNIKRKFDRDTSATLCTSWTCQNREEGRQE